MMSVTATVLILALSCNRQIHAEPDSKTQDEPHHFSQNPVWDHDKLLTELRRPLTDVNKIPNATLTRRLLKLAMSHDLDNDEALDAHELKHWLLESYSIWAEKEVKEKMSKTDSDFDGKISLEELVLERHHGLSEEALKELEKSSLDEKNLDSSLLEVLDTKTFFHGADRNNDNFLDKPELRSLMLPESYPFMIEINADIMMSRLDFNKDKAITMSEFMSNLHGDEVEDQWEEYEYEFKFLDLNDDGKITIPEIKLKFENHEKERLDENLKHLMNVADLNVDRKITWDELREKKIESAFMLDPITDVGRNLLYILDNDVEDENNSDSTPNKESEENLKNKAGKNTGPGDKSGKTKSKNKKAKQKDEL